MSRLPAALADQIDGILLNVLNSIGGQKASALSDDLSIAGAGLDSLAFSQLILNIEDVFGDLDESLVDKIIGSESIGDIRSALIHSLARKNG